MSKLVMEAITEAAPDLLNKGKKVALIAGVVALVTLVGTGYLASQVLAGQQR